MKVASLPCSQDGPKGRGAQRTGWRSLLGLAAMCLLPQAYAQGVVVYAQNFETVNATGTTCRKFGGVAAGYAGTGANDAGTLTDDYNGTGQEGTSGVFRQVATADRLCWDNLGADASIRLVDPGDRAGAYSGGFGRNATTNVESWGLAVDPLGQPFLNVSMDLSIVTPGSVNPGLGQTTPEEFTLVFYAIPGDDYTLSAAPPPSPNTNPAAPAIVAVPAGTATVLQTQTVSVTKAPATSRYQSEWQTRTFSVDTSALTPGQRVVMVSTARYPNNYFAFDNIRITAAPSATPTVSLSCSNKDLTDSPGQVATCTVTANQPVNAPLTVPFTGPAANARYTTTCVSPFQIPVGGSSASCTLTAEPNTVPGDGDVIATLALSAPAVGAGYQLGTPVQDSVTVRNDDVAWPVASLACAPAALTDSAGQVATCTVTLDVPAPAGGLSLNLTPPGASPRYSSDCASPLIVAAGASQATCSVTATDNSVPGDGSATATLELLAGSGYTLGTALAQVTVDNDDLAPVPGLNLWGLLLASLGLGALTWRRQRARS